MPPEHRNPALGPAPLLSGPTEVVAGYYELEHQERFQAAQTLTLHRDEVAIWYRLLTLHTEAFRRGFDFTCPDEELQAHGLRGQLLALGLASSKAALDMLLVGYYSVAYAAIRHMTESWLLCRYAEAKPQAAASFYAPAPGTPEPAKLPPIRNIVDDLKARQPEWSLPLDRAYVTWLAMGKGSHPSGIGIVQANGERDGLGVLGATYHPNLCRDGFNHGLPASAVLVAEISHLQPQPQEWEGELTRIATRLGKQRSA